MLISITCFEEEEVGSGVCKISGTDLLNLWISFVEIYDMVIDIELMPRALLSRSLDMEIYSIFVTFLLGLQLLCLRYYFGSALLSSAFKGGFDL